MHIKSARFQKSVKNEYADTGMPEIAVCGKSNVGKSTLINYLTGNFKLARTSSAPGKTRLINFFVVNESFILVDLPGYGYAKASKNEQKSWVHMIESYLSSTKRLRALLVLIDIRHSVSENDTLMINYASHFGWPVIIAATKADKIAKTKRHEYISRITDALKVSYPVVPVSSFKKFGSKELLGEVEKVLTT